MVRIADDTAVIEAAIVLKAVREVEQAVAKATLSIAIIRFAAGSPTGIKEGNAE